MDRVSWDHKPIRIREVFEKDWEATSIEELGLPPFATIGSLASGRSYLAPRPNNTAKSRSNRHGFTFVPPLDFIS